MDWTPKLSFVPSPGTDRDFFKKFRSSLVTLFEVNKKVSG